MLSTFQVECIDITTRLNVYNLIQIIGYMYVYSLEYMVIHLLFFFARYQKIRKNLSRLIIFLVFSDEKSIIYFLS
jgi:hypothetical protein